MNKKIKLVILIILAISTFIIIFNTQINHIDSSKQTNSNIEEKNTITGSQVIATKKTPYITLYSLPNGSAPNSILVGNDGMVWVTSSKLKTLYRINPEDNTMREYQSQQVSLGSMSWSMVQDNEGFIWFSQFGTDSLVRFDPNNGNFLAFHPKDSPFQMKHDSKTDNIWFTTLSGTLGLVQKTNAMSDASAYKITEFSVGDNIQNSGLKLDNDSLWITELDGKIIKFDPVYANNSTIINLKKTLEVPHGNQSIFSLPTDILPAKNNILWITEHGPSTLTRFDLETQKAIQFPTAKSYYHVATLPFWLRSSLDDKGIWLNEHEGGSIAFFTNNMTLTEYQVPVNSSDSIALMLNLASDPNNPNKMWFSLWSLDEIGVVDKSIPIPFDIHAENNLIQFTNDSLKKIIPLEITKSGNSILQDNIVYLNASSSLDSGADIVNMSATFSQDKIDLNNITSQFPIDLSLKNQSLQKRNYTIGISVGNDLVTRTIFAHVNVG